MSKHCWNSKAETMSRDELAALQLARLRAVVKTAWERNAFYRGAMDKANLWPGDLEGLEDVRRLPTTQKEDFRVQYPLGLLCVDRRELREMHMSSGSTGSPVVMAYTHREYAWMVKCAARVFPAAGVLPAGVDADPRPAECGSRRLERVRKKKQAGPQACLSRETAMPVCAIRCWR